MREISVYALSANPVVADGIKSFLQSEKFISLSGYSDTLDYTLKNSHKSNPDILFIDDSSFDKHNLINFLNRDIRPAANTISKTVIFTDSFETRYIDRLSLSDVGGILHKKETFLHTAKRENELYSERQIKADRKKFIDTLKLINRGCVCYDSLIHSILKRNYAWAYSENGIISNVQAINEELDWHLPENFSLPQQRIETLVKSLTPKEREVLLFIPEGRKNKVIAELLHISVATVETHKANITKKLNMKSSTELLVFASRNEVNLKIIFSKTV